MRFAILICGILTLACGSDNPVTPVSASKDLAVVGAGKVSERYTGEIWVQGNVAYTTTWGFRSAPGNAVKIWDVSGNVPTQLVASRVYASDMLNGIWKLAPVPFPPD